jgi:hypothetical protein
MNPAISQSLPILSLVVVGFVLKQLGMIRTGDSQVMARLILNITLPALIFLSVAQVNVAPGQLALLALCGIVVTLGLSLVSSLFVSYLGMERQVGGVFILATMIISVGFFLFPVFSIVYGHEGIGRLAAFDLGNTLVASTLGFFVATRYGNKPLDGVWRSIQRVLSLPILWAVFAGLLVHFLHISLNPFALRIIEPLAAASVPLAMLTLGAFLQFRMSKIPLMGLAVAIRMGGGFLLGQALIKLAHLEGLDRAAVGIGAAMPCGMAVMVYAASEGLDTEFAAGTISLSILAGMVVLPFLLSLY